MKTKENNVENDKVEKTTQKKQQPSKTRTLEQIKNLKKSLKELEWITEEEEKQLTEIQEKCKEKFIKSL